MVTVIPPGPGAIVIEAAHRAAASPGLAMSDVLRWVGMAVAVAGTVLATPHGIASLWRAGQRSHRKALAFGKHLLRRPQRVMGHGGVTLRKASMTAKGHVHTWQEWRQRAGLDLKIEILHEQVYLLLERINRLYVLVDQNEEGLRAEIRKSADGITGQIRQLESDLRGERTQASQVDARGFGPIALGIVLTGIPDELGGVTPGGWLGWLIVALSACWIIWVSPQWLRDYQQALKDAG